MDLGLVPHLRPPEPTPSLFSPDPLFPRASEILSAASSDGAAAVLLGIPFAAASISRARCDLAPAAVRRALGRFGTYSSDADVALRPGVLLDAGDLDCTEDVLDTQSRIETALRAILDQRDVPAVLLGGDNSVTVGGAGGTGADGLLTFDAHHDVRDGTTNGSPVRQLLERGMSGSRVVQIGIHGFANSAEYSARAHKVGITWVTPAEVRSRGIDAVVAGALERLAVAGSRRVWVDVDLDCLDRAFSPGTAASMPGGLWPGDLERAALLCGRSLQVAGLDITELDPSCDVADTTTRTACAVLLSFLAGVVSR